MWFCTYFTIVEDILYTALETLPGGHVLPVIMHRVELLDEQATQLQRRIHIQVLVEGRNRTGSLAVRIVEFCV